MNDRDLILGALMSGAPPRRARKVAKPIFQDTLDVGADPIFKPVKSRKSSFKKERTIPEWIGADFVKYFTKGLSQLGVTIETNVRDSDWMMKVYDVLVDVFGTSMDNYVLRDYIDWWIGMYAKIRSDDTIGVFSLNRDVDISRFAKHCALRPGKPQAKVKTVKNDVEISPDEMYKISGLTIVLMQYGIVEAYRVLVQNGESVVFAKLSDALKKCSKEIVKSVLNVTLSKKYSSHPIVDFMSVARPALKFHGLEKQFDHLSYKDYFVEATAN